MLIGTELIRSLRAQILWSTLLLWASIRMWTPYPMWISTASPKTCSSKMSSPTRRRPPSSGSCAAAGSPGATGSRHAHQPGCPEHRDVDREKARQTGDVRRVGKGPCLIVKSNQAGPLLRMAEAGFFVSIRPYTGAERTMSTGMSWVSVSKWG